MTNHDFVAEMQARDLFHQDTGPELKTMLANEKVTGYIGFDPTASSLHVGSLLPVIALIRLQKAGHRPIAIVGGGTGLIGDPSGKSAERPLLDTEQLQANLLGLRSQLERFLDFSGSQGALLINNADWLCSTSLTDFLRDIGKHFSVNSMLARDSVKIRLETAEQGMSFTEFSYMLLQSYDFLVLYDRYGCRLQMGGSDQWGNMVSGCDLIRRKRSVSAHALTFPLVTRSDGKKFGKSEQGNIWLDAKLTSPFDFYQFWFNTNDEDVEAYLKKFTFLTNDEIDELVQAHREQPERREAQRLLAQELTKMVHDEAALQRAEQATEALFGTGNWSELSSEALQEAFAHTPTIYLGRDELSTVDLAALVAKTGLSRSRGQARKDIAGGGIYVNNVRATQADQSYTANDLLANEFLVLRRGKKAYHVVRFSAGPSAAQDE